MKFKVITSLIIVSAFFALMISGCSLIEEDLISTSSSPNNVYTVEAYRNNGNATVDFSVKVYLLDDNRKKLIYNKYREYDAEITWVNDNIIIINGVTLDLSKGETYDWRDDTDTKKSNMEL